MQSVLGVVLELLPAELEVADVVVLVVGHCLLVVVEALLLVGLRGQLRVDVGDLLVDLLQQVLLLRSAVLLDDVVQVLLGLDQISLQREIR